MTLPQIKLVTGHKSETVAQKYIDQSTIMKQQASDVLSLGGLQKDRDGHQLRKRKTLDEDSNDTPLASTKIRQQERSSTGGSARIIYNMNFNN